MEDQKDQNVVYEEPATLGKSGPDGNQNRRKCAWCRKTAVPGRSLCVRCSSKRKLRYEETRNKKQRTTYYNGTNTDTIMTSTTAATVATTDDEVIRVRLAQGLTTVKPVLLSVNANQSIPNHRIFLQFNTTVNNSLVTAISIPDATSSFHFYLSGHMYPVISDEQKTITFEHAEDLSGPAVSAQIVAFRLFQHKNPQDQKDSQGQKVNGLYFSEINRPMIIFERPIHSFQKFTVVYHLENNRTEEIIQCTPASMFSIALSGAVHSISLKFKEGSDCSTEIKSRIRINGSIIWEASRQNPNVFVASDLNCSITSFHQELSQILEPWQKATSIDTTNFESVYLEVEPCSNCQKIHTLEEFAHVSWYSPYRMIGVKEVPVLWAGYECLRGF